MSKESEENRRISYHMLGDRKAKTSAMLNLLKTKNESFTDSEISELLQIEMSSVCSIRNALVKKELVESTGSKFNKLTNRPNTLWTATN